MDNKLKKYEAAIISILSEYATIKYANIVGGNQLIVLIQSMQRHKCYPVHLGLLLYRHSEVGVFIPLLFENKLKALLPMS